MFLQLAVPSGDNRCLRFFWREDSKQKIKVHMFIRPFLGKSSPTCANYSLHEMANNKANEDKKVVKIARQNVYKNQPKSTQRFGTASAKIEFNLRKLITSDENVKSPIKEADKSRRELWKLSRPTHNHH